MSSNFRRFLWHSRKAAPWLGAALFCLLAASLPRPAEAGLAGLLPHRALYQVRLLKSGGDVADVDGQMAFEWQDSCDGWSVSQRSLMQFLYASGDQASIGWSLTSWEAEDGSSYRFVVRQSTDGDLVAEYRGDARLAADGSGGRASYSQPPSHTVALPAGSLFPTQHSLALIEHATKGDQMVWREVFDGSDEQGLFGVNAVITALPEAARKAADQRAELKGVPSWRVALAFYAPGSQAAEPEHEQNLQLYANGVVDRLELNYGDFSILATLSKLEALPKPSC